MSFAPADTSASSISRERCGPRCLRGRAARATIIGEDHPREHIARFLYSTRVRTSGKHVVEQDLELASSISGTTLAYAQAPLPKDDAAEAWAHEETMDGPVVLINPGAGWGAKCWPADRYAEVARALEADGYAVLVNAGPREEELAAAVARGCQEARVIECSLGQLIAIMRRTTLFIGGDTGPLHLAAMLRVPTVGIFGPTDPERNGPYETEAVVLRSSASRRDHSRRTEPEAGLLQILPQQVLAAAHSLLGARA